MSEKDLAIKTLCSICEDNSYPATARASAARTLLELLGLIGRLQSEVPNVEKSLVEMTYDEIIQELDKRKSALDTTNLVDTVDTTKRKKASKASRAPRAKHKNQAFPWE